MEIVSSPFRAFRSTKKDKTELGDGVQLGGARVRQVPWAVAGSGVADDMQRLWEGRVRGAVLSASTVPIAS